MNADRGPRLLTTRASHQPKGVVLVLHGGAARRDNPPVSPSQLSVIRMVPIAARSNSPAWRSIACLPPATVTNCVEVVPERRSANLAACSRGATRSSVPCTMSTRRP